MKITKEENGNIRISDIGLFSKFKSAKSKLKSKKGKIKEKVTSKPAEKESSETTSRRDTAKVVKKAPKKLSEEEKKSIYEADVAKASANSFLPSIRDGYIVYWELMNGSVVKRFGKYEDIKDKPNVAIRKSDVREIHLIESGKEIEEKIKSYDESNVEFPEFKNDVERAKNENNNVVPSMLDGYVTYYDIADGKIIKRFGKYDDVIKNPNCYVRYVDRSYYEELNREKRHFAARLAEADANVDMEQFNKDEARIYEELGHFPTPSEGYVSYYKNGVKRFGKYEDIYDDAEVTMDDEDRQLAEDYRDFQNQIRSLEELAKNEEAREEQILKQTVVEQTNRSLHKGSNKVPEKSKAVDSEEESVDETTRFLEEANDLYDEIIGSDDEENHDLEEAIVEETARSLSERDNQERDVIDLTDEEVEIIEPVIKENHDSEEESVDETTRFLEEADGLYDEIIGSDDEENQDLEKAIVEEAARSLSERDSNNSRSTEAVDYGRLEDLNLPDEEKEYFENLANEYIGYLENPTVFKFEKEYKVKSKY